MAPNDLCPLEMAPCVSPYSLFQGWFVWQTGYSTSHLQDLILKNCHFYIGFSLSLCVSLPFSLFHALISLALGEELSWAALWGDSHGEELKPPVHNHISEIGSSYSSPSQLFRDCISGQRFDYNLIRDSELDPPAKPLPVSWPLETE